MSNKKAYDNYVKVRDMVDFIEGVKNNRDISYGYKFVDGNIGVSEEEIVTLPLYMIAFI